MNEQYVPIRLEELQRMIRSNKQQDCELPVVFKRS